MARIRPHNVVLIGSTGHGKSTFGNFLMSCGAENVFETSHKMETCTKRPQQYLITEDVAEPINVIDTPGLNDENDLQQMIEVLKHLHLLGDVTAVLFCLNFDQRGDVNIKATMQYYKSLLEPVFSSHNLVLVLTNVNSDDFKNAVTSNRLESLINERKSSCSKLFGIEIQVCELVNSVIPKHKKEKVKSMIASGSSSIKEKGPKNIYVSSILSRERILQRIPTMKRVDISKHEFPLPPVLESKRAGKLRRLQGLRAELINTVGVESDTRATVLQSINDLEEDISNIEDKIKPIQEKLIALKGTQKTEPLYLYGDEVFFLGRIKNKTIEVPIKDYKMNSQSWNCDYQVVNYENGIITLDVIPEFLSLLKVKSRVTDTGEKRWWILVWAEYSGEQAFPDIIQRLEKEILQEKVQLDKLESHLKKLKHQDEQLDVQLSAHKTRLDELVGHTNLLCHNLFNLDVIETVVQLLVDVKKEY